MKIITVTVTSEHIATGKPRTPWSCPIALAIAALGIPSPSIGETCWRPDAHNTNLLDEIPLPKSAQRFITRFDAEDPTIQPFRFRTQIDERYLRGTR